MKPETLFAIQLKERLGQSAASRLQLTPHPHEESSNPPLDKAQELAADSHRPAPQLRDYIFAASRRDPIPADASNARPVEDLTSSIPEARNRKSLLVITNGWLTMDGQLLIGQKAEAAWRRGSIRPKESGKSGLEVTRFVPGRTGPGFTDDLNEVADTLIKSGSVALDHNYDLWYDRRRDDHERVRRLDGGVFPPFF